MAFLRGVRRSPKPSVNAVTDSISRDVFAYEMILIRHMEQDSMLWQTPALAITGQAFLLTLAFDGGIHGGGRAAAALLGVFIAVMSMQLMAKHRYLSRLDEQELRRLERVLGLPQIAKRKWVDENGTPRPEPVQGFWLSKSSYTIWLWGLGLFLLVNASALVALLVSLVGELLVGLESFLPS